jgi:hypothetical protein
MGGQRKGWLSKGDGASPIPPMALGRIGKERPTRGACDRFSGAVVFAQAGIAKFSCHAQIMGKAFTGCAG